MALPAAARRRWNLSAGGSVDVADLGDALVIMPSSGGGLRAFVADAIAQSGGYAALVADVVATDEDLR